MWLVEHLNDPNVVILDSRGNVAYSYVHIPNSQPLGVGKVIISNQYGTNLVLDADKAANLFGPIGLVHLLTGLEEDFLLADLRLRLVPQTGHCDIFEKIFLHPEQK